MNIELSESRAKAVMKYLIEKGIDSERLQAKGYGSKAPAIPIKGLKGRKLRDARKTNRRVQFEILERSDP